MVSTEPLLTWNVLHCVPGTLKGSSCITATSRRQDAIRKAQSLLIQDRTKHMHIFVSSASQYPIKIKEFFLKAVNPQQ